METNPSARSGAWSSMDARVSRVSSMSALTGRASTSGLSYPYRSGKLGDAVTPRSARSAKLASSFAAIYSGYANRFVSTAYPELKFVFHTSGGDRTVTDPAAIRELSERIKNILEINLPSQNPSGGDPAEVYFCHSACFTPPPKSRSRR